MTRTNATDPLQALAGRACGRVLEALRIGPDCGIHVRELARGAKLSLSSLQRELNRLSSLGALRRTLSGNRVAHRLRRDDPFVRLLLSAATAAELRGRCFEAMPADRETERAFVKLCAHLPPEPELWRPFGDAGFLAGVAIALAGHSGFSRASYLSLAGSLLPGAAAVEQHRRWYRKHRPDLPRFFSLLDRERRTHARVENQ